MNDYIWLIWDLAAAAIIIFCVYTCARRGLLRNVISFLAYLIAAAAAKYFSPIAAEFLYDRFIKDAVVLSVNNKLGDTIASGRDFAVKLVESFPAFLRSFLPLPEELVNGGYLAMQTRDIIEEIVDSAVKGPVVMLAGGLCFMIIFSLVLFLSRRIARIFTGVYRIPIIGPLNTFFGGVTGLLQAVITLLVAAFVIGVVIQLSGDRIAWLNRGVMDETYIWRVFFLFVVK